MNEQNELKTIQFTRISKRLKLPFVLHRGGKGKPGRGSAWVIESLYPRQVPGPARTDKVFACEPTLSAALKSFYKAIKSKP